MDAHLAIRMAEKTKKLQRYADVQASSGRIAK